MSRASIGRKLSNYIKKLSKLKWLRAVLLVIFVISNLLAFIMPPVVQSLWAMSFVVSTIGWVIVIGIAMNNTTNRP